MTTPRELAKVALGFCVSRGGRQMSESVREAQPWRTAVYTGALPAVTAASGGANWSNWGSTVPDDELDRERRLLDAIAPPACVVTKFAATRGPVDAVVESKGPGRSKRREATRHHAMRLVNADPSLAPASGSDRLWKSLNDLLTAIVDTYEEITRPPAQWTWSERMLKIDLSQDELARIQRALNRQANSAKLTGDVEDVADLRAAAVAKTLDDIRQRGERSMDGEVVVISSSGTQHALGACLANNLRNIIRESLGRVRRLEVVARPHDKSALLRRSDDREESVIWSARIERLRTCQSDPVVDVVLRDLAAVMRDQGTVDVTWLTETVSNAAMTQPTILEPDDVIERVTQIISSIRPEEARSRVRD